VHLEKKSKDEIKKLAAQPRFDYQCWDLYARVSQWYEQDKKNLDARLDALHQIEAGKNEIAEVAEIVSIAVLRRHLETMERLGIEYDFLPRESEILHLHFWDAAFKLLKERGVLRLESEGKNKGCWVMSRGSAKGKSEDLTTKDTKEDTKETIEEDQKVIVRSNGTVTYVGKDIAYHLWKFGLLGKDFGYKKFFRYPNGHECWISADQGESQHPTFAGVSAIYNVVDSRQADPQNNVIEAIRALGYAEQSRHFTHFSYEMVALTPRCAAELGYALSPEEEQKAYIEVSGRKGFGVKADDLIDALIAAAKLEVDSRHADIPDSERADIAMQIAVGALRYFMLKYTKNSVIAFDFRDALAFEGETGPYAQYAVVRATNIFRKAGISSQSTVQSSQPELAKFLTGEKGEPKASAGPREPEARAGSPTSPSLTRRGETGQQPAVAGVAEPSDERDEFWELWLAAAKLDFVVEQCIATTEPAYAAKYVFQLAQLFNNFYHRHHILTEPDEAKKNFLLATVAVVSRSLTEALEMMGISVPRVM
jgi:arginyl-tRNA synthetase